MSMARRILAAFSLFGSFIYDIVAASIAVARIVLFPDQGHQPAIVAVPIDAQTRWGVALFAYLVSLTPGSTSLHVSDDRRTLYVHFINAPDTVASGTHMKALYESRIIRIEGREPERR